MNRLEQLPEVTNHVLSGLKADDSLKHRILLSAAESSRVNPFRFRTVIALCSLSVLLILLCVFVARAPVNYGSTADIQVIPAGSRRIVSPVNMQQMIDQASGIDRDAPAQVNGAE